MLTCNDIDYALQNLKTTKGLVDEQVVVDCSSKAQKSKLLAYARKNRSVNVYESIGLGFPEPFMPFAVSKCRNSWILLLDADEKPSEEFLTYLKTFKPEWNAAYVKRYEGMGGNFSTWQLRLFRKGKVGWLGLLHEHPKVLGKKVKLDKRLYLVHLRAGLNREYNRLGMFIKEWRVRRILINTYIQARVDPKIVPLALKRTLRDTRRTTEEKEISRLITSRGLIKFLGLDTERGVKALVSKYKGKKQGADLLLAIVTERYRRMKQNGVSK